ncbi:hypothetical protein [Pseudomonas sp. PS01303]|uniref:hypothetical protein n=1 Tax=Pseudomonas sp. PS01303 TaxID=2991439 RepID=UPI00249C14D1|nr:hypothetical protein [Pseudomonas sp. PS01303]
MKTLAALATCLLALSGCQDSEEQRLLTIAEAAKKSIAANYKDPDSVLFKNLTLDWNKKHICGELNAKNGFGGYIGYDVFRAELKGAGAQTSIASMWTIRDRLNQIFDDSMTGRITEYEAGKARLNVIFESTCTDADSSKSPIFIPVKI